jgi:hypothetical protein
MKARSQKSEASSQKKAPPVNTTQLAYLRDAAADVRAGGVGAIVGDGSTIGALVRRGYAEQVDGHFYITRAGVERSKKKADGVALTTAGTKPDPSLLEDLP